MTAIEILKFDQGVKRWWVLRGPDLAVSLTAVILQTTDLLDGAIRFVIAPDGARLSANCFTAHRPGTAPEGKDCPALGRDCNADEALSGARQTLADWAATGHDDAVISLALAEHYAREAGA